MQPSREVFWNIQFGWIVYVLGVIALGIFIYAIYRRSKLWGLGKPENRLNPIGKRIWTFIFEGVVDGLLHRKFFGITDSRGDRPVSLQFKELYPGLIHFLIFAGCIIFLVGSFLDFVSHYFFDFLHGGIYLAYSAIVDVFGILVLIGVILAIIRRYVQKPHRLDNKGEDLVALLLIFFVVLTGFIVEGFRIAATELKAEPSWAPWSPGGYILALAYSGLSQTALLSWHRVWWWIHMLLGIGAIVYVSLFWNRLWHIIVSPFNVFLKTLELPRGPMSREEFAIGKSYGTAHVEDFTWKQLLDLDACTRCGRCQDACPAYATDKPLNPKKVILDLKASLLERASKSKDKAVSKPVSRVVSDIVGEDAIWECTTCNSCMEVCPVAIEHVPKIIGMRRSLVEMRSKFPQELIAFFENIEQRSNPWGIAPADRAKWATDIEVKPFQAGQTEYLFYVGCTGSFDARSRQVTLATAKILNSAGISWGILGRDEKCCGDSLRRLGNEFVFDSLAKENIKMFQEKGVKKIITQCPHCFSTFKNDYRQYGAQFEVIHHTQLIHRLIQENKLKLNRDGNFGKVVFHDSCYLGRHNGVYEVPREIVTSVTNEKPTEMKRSYDRSFCCGGGGGGMWWEEKIGKRISIERVEEALKADPKTICVCCPYCLTMFEDGLKDKKLADKVKTLDVAEIVASALK